MRTRKEEFSKMENGHEVSFTIPIKRPFKNVYQFKITLLGTNPPVWRSILIPESYTFYDLHCAIQDAMGWEDCHLHGFDIKYEPPIKIPIPRSMSMIHVECPYAEPDIEENEPLYTTEIQIKEYFKKENDKIMYVYDYGDGWRHEVLLEKIMAKDSKAKYPICVDGQLSCPPEDCGSIPGYYECIDALKNNDDSEGKLTWLGDWMPDNFDPAKVKFKDPRKRFLDTMSD